MKKFADVIDYTMLMDPAVLEEKLAAGDAENCIAPIKIAHNVEVSPITPYEYSEYHFSLIIYITIHSIQFTLSTSTFSLFKI